MSRSANRPDMNRSAHAPRQRILNAPRELFYKSGIRAVGVDAIAEAASTNKMTLYRHFGSKDDLVAAYLQDLAEEKTPIRTMANNSIETRDVKYINAYLVSGPEIYIEPRNENLSGLNLMAFGNMPIDGGFLSFNKDEIESAGISKNFQRRFIRKIYGAAEYIRGQNRYCFWIGDNAPAIAAEEPIIKIRLDQVQKFRSASKRPATRELAGEPHRFGWVAQSGNEVVTILPRILSERREYITVGHEPARTLTTDQAYALYDAPLWNMAIIASRLHIVWIATVCGNLKTDFRYSNTLGWNTFPLPLLTEKNKADLASCAEDILLAREAHFPANIADLYDPDKMPENLRHTHERNDEVLERIYIGRRFKNDTERLEKLFDLYTKMTATNGKKS